MHLVKNLSFKIKKRHVNFKYQNSVISILYDVFKNIFAFDSLINEEGYSLFKITKLPEEKTKQNIALTEKDLTPRTSDV